MLQTVFFFQVKIGRMKTCFTLENQMSPSVYETVSFSRVIERLAGFSGDVCGNQGGRDMGLQVGGELFKTSVDDYFWNIGQVYTMVPDSA